MKKLILIIFVSLMFANIGFAEMRLIEEKDLEGNNRLRFQTTCIDGYKFVSVYKTYTNAMGLSITQAFEERDGKSLPAKC